MRKKDVDEMPKTPPPRRPTYAARASSTRRRAMTMRDFARVFLGEEAPSLEEHTNPDMVDVPVKTPIAPEWIEREEAAEAPATPAIPRPARRVVMTVTELPPDPAPPAPSEEPVQVRVDPEIEQEAREVIRQAEAEVSSGAHVFDILDDSSELEVEDDSEEERDEVAEEPATDEVAEAPEVEEETVDEVDEVEEEQAADEATEAPEVDEAVEEAADEAEEPASEEVAEEEVAEAPEVDEAVEEADEADEEQVADEVAEAPEVAEVVEEEATEAHEADEETAEEAHDLDAVEEVVEAPAGSSWIGAMRRGEGAREALESETEDAPAVATPDPGDRIMNLLSKISPFGAALGTTAPGEMGDFEVVGVDDGLSLDALSAAFGAGPDDVLAGLDVVGVRADVIRGDEVAADPEEAPLEAEEPSTQARDIAEADEASEGAAEALANEETETLADEPDEEVASGADDVATELEVEDDSEEERDEVAEEPATDEVAEAPEVEEETVEEAADEVAEVDEEPAADEVAEAPEVDEAVEEAADEVVEEPATDEVAEAPEVDEETVEEVDEVDEAPEVDEAEEPASEEVAEEEVVEAPEVDEEEFSPFEDAPERTLDEVSRADEAIRELAAVRGVGDVRAAQMHRELGLTRVSDIIEAGSRGELRTLKGVGPKTEEAMVEAAREALEGLARDEEVDAEGDAAGSPSPRFASLLERARARAASADGADEADEAAEGAAPLAELEPPADEVQELSAQDAEARQPVGLLGFEGPMTSPMIVAPAVLVSAEVYAALTARVEARLVEDDTPDEPLDSSDPAEEAIEAPEVDEVDEAVEEAADEVAEAPEVDEEVDEAEEEQVADEVAEAPEAVEEEVAEAPEVDEVVEEPATDEVAEAPEVEEETVEEVDEVDEAPEVDEAEEPASEEVAEEEVAEAPEVEEIEEEEAADEVAEAPEAAEVVEEEAVEAPEVDELEEEEAEEPAEPNVEAGWDDLMDGDASEALEASEGEPEVGEPTDAPAAEDTSMDKYEVALLEEDLDYIERLLDERERVERDATAEVSHGGSRLEGLDVGALKVAGAAPRGAQARPEFTLDLWAERSRAKLDKPELGVSDSDVLAEASSEVEDEGAAPQPSVSSTALGRIKPVRVAYFKSGKNGSLVDLSSDSVVDDVSSSTSESRKATSFDAIFSSLSGGLEEDSELSDLNEMSRRRRNHERIHGISNDFQVADEVTAIGLNAIDEGVVAPSRSFSELKRLEQEREQSARAEAQEQAKVAPEEAPAGEDKEAKEGAPQARILRPTRRKRRRLQRVPESSSRRSRASSSRADRRRLSPSSSKMAVPDPDVVMTRNIDALSAREHLDTVRMPTLSNFGQERRARPADEHVNSEDEILRLYRDFVIVMHRCQVVERPIDFGKFSERVSKQRRMAREKYGSNALVMEVKVSAGKPFISIKPRS